MALNRFLRHAGVVLSLTVAVPLAAQSAFPGQEAPDRTQAASGQNCTFAASPERFSGQEAAAVRSAYERTLAFTRSSVAAVAGSSRAVTPDQIPIRGFIDEEILARLKTEKMLAAPLSSDYDFLRRVTFDIAGRAPTSDEIRQFVADKSPGKRDAVIDRLIDSQDFIEKWTIWLGDILQNAATAQNRSQQIEGRNRLHEWIRISIAFGKSWRDIAYETVASQGNNYDRTASGANFMVRGFAPMGPAQDTYDLTMVRAATMFLGLSHYDCLLCHNGKRHLDAITVWGARTLRLEAQQMAAHFARSSLAGYQTSDTTDFYYNSTNVLERASGTYDLNTSYGNRPNRTPATINGKQVTNLTPVYRDGTPASGAFWRDSFVRSMINDPMFSRNFANRVWKAMFTLALAEPVDGLDPDRLDPSVPPPAGWTYQASHPVLLEKLAKYARDTDYNLREMVRFIAKSSAYQLSARYDQPWDLTKAPLFARRLARRLEAEEVHDEITRATGLLPSYTVGGWVDKVNYALLLPEPVEPRSDGTAAGFMNSFNRGNRDTLQRSDAGSIQMWLNMMNSPFVMNRVRASGSTASPYLAAMAANKNDQAVVEDMFLTFLSRPPTDYEKGVALKTLARATTTQYTRVMAVEDLAWAVINKTDFLFSY
jgi:hypothetical protein